MRISQIAGSLTGFIFSASVVFGELAATNAPLPVTITVDAANLSAM